MKKLYVIFLLTTGSLSNAFGHLQLHQAWQISQIIFRESDLQFQT